jgi:hypothetical protein
MPGRGFLNVARDAVAGATKYHWRAAAVHAFYALFLECRDALFRWGFAMPRRDNVHAWVRLRFTYAADPDLKSIGHSLDDLVQLRNAASYDLRPGVPFASPPGPRMPFREPRTRLHCSTKSTATRHAGQRPLLPCPPEQRAERSGGRVGFPILRKRRQAIRAGQETISGFPAAGTRRFFVLR